MIEVLKAINYRIISGHKDNPEELQKQELIKKILSEKDCFLKIDITTAYQILEDLKIPQDKMRNVYLELINPEKEGLFQ